MNNPDGFEVLCISGKIGRIKEKVVVIAVYMPPNYPRNRADMCLDYISDVIAAAKRQVESPIVIVGGDWNQWPVKPVLADHADLSEVQHGPTRGNRNIDKFLTNSPQSISESDTLPPLDDGQGRDRDHLVAFFKASFPIPDKNTVRYRYRHYTDEGAELFNIGYRATVSKGSITLTTSTLS